MEKNLLPYGTLLTCVCWLCRNQDCYLHQLDRNAAEIVLVSVGERYGSYPMAVDVMSMWLMSTYSTQTLLVIAFPQPMDPLQVSICGDSSLNFTVV